MVRVRAQRKYLSSPKADKQCSDLHLKPPKKTSPKMNGFQGKLSHASPPKTPQRSMNTRYFAKFQQRCLGEMQLMYTSDHLNSQNGTDCKSNLASDKSLLEQVNIEIPSSEHPHLPSSPRTSPRLQKTATEQNNTPSNTVEDSIKLEIKTEYHLTAEELPQNELKVENQLCEATNQAGEVLQADAVPCIDHEEVIVESDVNVTPRKALKMKDEPKCLFPPEKLESVISPPLHKIQLSNDVTAETLSPSSALSFIQISTPTKPVKSKRRLNPSQTSNQQKTANPNCTTARGMSKKNVSSTLNHKLTEYYPIVRRSVRKTKRTVLEEKQMMLEEAVKTECEDGLEIRNFEGKGRGIVTTRRFYKGDFVVEYSGELIDMGEAKTREQLYTQDQNTGCYMYYFKYKNNQYCIDATKESGRLGRLVNHSRNGNLITKTVPIGSKPHLVLIAKECIEEGEEVLYDYGDRSKESLINHPWLNL